MYYDEGGASANALGRVTHRTDPTGADTYTYDTHLPRVTQIQKGINGTNYTSGYQYNLANQVTSLTYPSGRVVQQNYDAIGRASSSVSGTTTLASGFTYDPAFHETKMNYGSGVVQTTSYSPDRMQLTCLDYASQNSSGQCQTTQYSLFSLSYGYTQSGGNDGEITGITDGVQPGRSLTHTYDALGRLSKSVSTGSSDYPQWGLQWTYDRYGNPTNETQLYDGPPTYSVTVDPTTNHISSQRFGYDLAGHMTNDAVNALTYDGEDRVVSSSGSLGSGSYTVRASGLRVMKGSGGTTTVYVYDGHRPIAEYVNGTLSKEYVYSGNRMIAEYNGGTLYYHHSDHLSPRLTTDASGNKVGEQGHYPFGESWYMTNTTTKYQMTSYERDSESANDYAKHRYHVNRMGRFSSVDAKAGCPKNPQNLNRYSYVKNDPINRKDPRGLMDDLTPEDGGGGGGDGGGGGGGGGGGDGGGGYGGYGGGGGDGGYGGFDGGFDGGLGGGLDNGCDPVFGCGGGCDAFESPDCGDGCDPVFGCGFSDILPGIVLGIADSSWKWTGTINLAGCVYTPTCTGTCTPPHRTIFGPNPLKCPPFEVCGDLYAISIGSGRVSCLLSVCVPSTVPVPCS